MTDQTKYKITFVSLYDSNLKITTSPVEEDVVKAVLTMYRVGTPRSLKLPIDETNRIFFLTKGNYYNYAIIFEPVEE